MRLYSRDEPPAASPPPGIRMAERQRPAVARHAQHVTREAEEARVDRHPEAQAARRVFDQTSLKAPPPRNGFTQRWVSDGTNPQASRSEQRNWFNKKRSGWQIRNPDTVPPELRDLYPSEKLANGQDCIRVAGMVLCELPLNVAREYKHAVDDRILHLSQAIPESLEELRKRERTGVGPLQVGNNATTFRGRRAANYVD